MPIFHLNLKQPTMTEPDDIGLECRDLHHAYLAVCRAIPDLARDLLIEGKDPMACAYIICDAAGRRLMEVPFSEVLSPAQWRFRRARRRPFSSPRSKQSRDDLALSSFRTMFSAVNVGCVLLTPEFEVREINAFGARHGHVDANAIRDISLIDVFGVTGKPKRDFRRFLLLARAGETSEFVNLPYVMLDEHGETTDGWWDGRAWPIFDDNDHLLGLVQWAQPYLQPTASGPTLVRVTSGRAR